MHYPKKTLLSTLIATAIAGSSLCTWYAVAAEAAPGNPVTTEQFSGRYAIHIASLNKLNDAENLVGRLSFKQLAYISTKEINGVNWYRVRIGFFPSARDAEQVAVSLRKQHPELWITKVAQSEKSRAIAAATMPSPGITSPIPATPETETNTPETGKPDPRMDAAGVKISPEKTLPVTETKIIQQPQSKPVPVIKSSAPVAQATTSKVTSSLMEQAEQAMIAQEYNRAIQLYTKVLREPAGEDSKQALEFIGVARERKGQKAQAKVAWDQYLEKYPDGADADRVRQRLTALITAADTPVARSDRPARNEPSKWAWFGGISQFYRRDESTTETEDFETTSVNRSALSNDLYLTGRYRGDEYDMRTRFSGGYEENFLDSDESELRISTLYLDLQDKQANNTLRLGRQSSSTGGVLGRFDGFIAGHSFSEKMKLNMVAGYPVETSTYDEINIDRHFYGVNLDLGTYRDAWDYNLFLIEQHNDGVLDRRAIGGEMRYFQPGRTMFTLLDYDLSYDKLNTLFMLGSWTNEEKQTFNLSVDFRNSPTLTTTTAIQSQGVDTLSELLATGVTEDEARTYALDRTIRSFSTTLGIVQPVTDDFQLSGDLTVSKLDDSKASGGVEAIEGTDYEYSLFVQAIGNNLIKPGDLGIVGVRLTEATDSQRIRLILNSRYPVNDKLRINPRFQTEYRNNTDDNTSQWFVRPSVRTEYRWKRSTRFEFETGGEISNRELTDDTSETTSFFINLGYRHDF